MDPSMVAMTLNCFCPPGVVYLEASAILQSPLFYKHSQIILLAEIRRIST